MSEQQEVLLKLLNNYHIDTTVLISVLEKKLVNNHQFIEPLPKKIEQNLVLM